jgi:hypothetical protein
MFPPTLKQRRSFLSCLILISLLAATCLLTGCIYPHTSERSEEVRGRVLDAKTRIPIEDAKIYFAESPHHPTYSDAKGNFRMKATRNFHWSGNVAGGSWPYPKTGFIEISHPNYLTAGAENGDNLLQPKP